MKFRTVVVLPKHLNLVTLSENWLTIFMRCCSLTSSLIKHIHLRVLSIYFYLNVFTRDEHNIRGMNHILFQMWNNVTELDIGRSVYHFLQYIYIYTFQRDTQCSSTDNLLMHGCQLYMFRTVTVHPQELLFRCCMCRLWYVVRTALSGTSRWYNVQR